MCERDVAKLGWRYGQASDGVALARQVTLLLVSPSKGTSSMSSKVEPQARETSARSKLKATEYVMRMRIYILVLLISVFSTSASTSTPTAHLLHFFHRALATLPALLLPERGNEKRAPVVYKSCAVALERLEIGNTVWMGEGVGVVSSRKS